MKKILALVLALVMTMSVAAISSSAAYSDADSVQYTDAVNTMSALGVLGGYADGSIRPQADVTRGAAAKMVAMVATGSNTTTIGYYAGTSSFADVPASHTFADAVAFCVARGIVAGYGDGNYGVADNVKGWAVAKMVLVAMGYDAKAYGMEGTGSALNTITLASTLGLFDGMKADFVATAAASREECAQIVYNALTLNGKKAVPVNSTGTIEYQNSGKCLLNNYGIEGALGATDAMTALAGNIGMVVENQDTGALYTKVGTTNYAVETGKELIGHMVLAVPNGAVDAYNVPCVYAVVDLSSVVEVSTADTYTLGTEAAYAAKFGSAVMTEAESGYASFSNYTKDAEARDGADVDAFTALAGTYVIYDDAIVSYLTSVSDLSVLTVSASNFAKGYYTVKLGDTTYVKVSANLDKSDFDKIVSDEAVNWLGMLTATSTTEEAVYITTVCGSKLAIAPVQTVSGKVTKVNASASKIYIDGKEYGFVTGETAAATALEVDVMTSDFADLTNTYEFYLDQDGKVFATKALTAADTNSYSLAYVAGTNAIYAGTDAYGYDSYTYNIQYFTADGSVKMASYAAQDGKNVVGYVVSAASEVEYAPLAEGWYLVADVAGGVAVKTINDATGYYVASGAVEGDVVLAATTTSAFGGFVTKASTFLYGEVDGISAEYTGALVKTGAHANTIEDGSNVAVVLKDSANVGQYDVVAVWVEDDFAGATLAVDFVYVVSYEGYIGLDATKTYALQSYKVIDKNGNAVDATYAGATAEAAAKVGGWYVLSTNTATGLTSLGADYSETIAAVADATSFVLDGVTYIDNGSEFVVASDVKFHDLRAEVVEYFTEDAVDSVSGMLAIEGEYAAYAIYTTDLTTGVSTISTIVIINADAGDNT